jgi:hypothetical protein
LNVHGDVISFRGDDSVLVEKGGGGWLHCQCGLLGGATRAMQWFYACCIASATGQAPGLSWLWIVEVLLAQSARDNPRATVDSIRVAVV